MDSLSPFQDLNQLPDSHAFLPATTVTATVDANAATGATSDATTTFNAVTSATSCITSPLLVPKLEPKLEPWDEPLATEFPQQPQNPQQPIFSTPAPDFQNTNVGYAETSSFPSEEDNVYSEFYRISELFRTAFGQRLHQFGDCNAVDPDSRAIVPVSQDNNQVSQVVVSPRQRTRRKELVRVTDLKIEGQRYFRDVIRRTRMIYDSLRVLTSLEEEKRLELPSPKKPRGDLKASSLMRDRGLWLNRDKRIVGSIPGIYIGDVFFFRMELVVVGLHGQPQAGIDYLPSSQSSNGEPIATSVIASGGYEDDVDGGDVIIYTGHGGQDKHSRQCVDQKLEGGNLAMERSMHYGVEVRVIRGIKYEGSVSSKIYAYDGLYRIVDCWFDVGKSGFGVFKYKLLRIEGQAEMGSLILRLAAALKSKPLEIKPRSYLSLDISNRRENVPIRLFNEIDRDHDPLRYEYLARTNFPQFVFHQSGNATGCDCVQGCGDNCFCCMKNGGEFPYNLNGILVRGKPIIFECGPFCRCPPECRNRVTQKGLRNRFEVFRSRETGWGVRSLDLIHAGAFICEYTGVVLTKQQAQILSMNGDTLIYPSRFSDRWAEWGDLSRIYSDHVRPSYPSIPPLDFAMDVSTMRNVACYMSHSSTPNVMVQFVLYDHNNLMFPHLMLFAMENIPPLRELSLDYGVSDELTGKLAICN